MLRSCFWVFILWIGSSTGAFAQTEVASQPADSVVTQTVKVKGITCAMDLKMIAANVEKVAGVRSCEPGNAGATTSFVIMYNPAVVTEKEIYLAIENTGSCEAPDERPYKVKE